MMFDQRTMGEAFGYPGIDPRQWVSHGVVDQDGGAGARSVRFADETGAPLDEGVLVDVTLQPSGIPVTCLYGMRVAGAGEAEYEPIGPGDHVVVAIPEGNETSGCTIVARLANKYDSFPQTVAGIDVTQNNVAFKRVKVPYIIESASSLMLSNALTGSQLSLAADGSVMLSSGDGHALAMNSSVLSFQSADGITLIQIDPHAGTVSFQADGTAFTVDPNASQFLTPGTLAIGTSGIGATGHAITAEQVALILQALLSAIGTALPGALTGSALAGAAATILPAAVALTPTLALLPALSKAVLAALATPTDPTGSLPGFGRAGLMF